jgi:hypothetical protein
LWKTCSVVFQAAVDGALSVHSCASVHAVVELKDGVRELHHLTGHYPFEAHTRLLNSSDYVKEAMGDAPTASIVRRHQPGRSP